MGSTLLTVIVAGLVSGLTTGLVTLLKLKTRDATAISVATMSADTADEISQRAALQEEQRRLNDERARLDEVRNGLEQGRSLEIGSLKVQLKDLQQAIAAEKELHATEIRELKERIRELERDLLQANIKIVRLQEGRTA